MGLESLKETIVRSAADERESILSEARAEAAAILLEYKKKGAAEQASSVQKIKQQTAQLKNRMLTQLRFEARHLLLEKRKEILSSVEGQAKAAFSQLQAEHKKRWVLKLLDRARMQMRVAKVYVNSKDLGFVTGVEAHPLEIVGGLIAENADGTIRLDYSFETLLEEQLQIDLPEVSKKLFD